MTTVDNKAIRDYVDTLVLDAITNDIPDFLLVANRVPLSAEKRAKLATLKLEYGGGVEDKWQRNRRLYDAEGARQKLLAAQKARPAKLEFYAKKNAATAAIKAAKDMAKAKYGK